MVIAKPGMMSTSLTFSYNDDDVLVENLPFWLYITTDGTPEAIGY